MRGALKAREQRIRDARARANQWRAERGYCLKEDLASMEFADYLRPMVLLSLNTGLRRGELFALRWCDLDTERAYLTVQGIKSKNGTTRHIPLNREALDVLMRWKTDSDGAEDLMFKGRQADIFNNVRRSWLGVLKAAGITKFRWHDMRHSFASRLAMAGIDLNTIRELLGHADYKMTLRYAHLAPEHKAAAVAKLVRA